MPTILDGDLANLAPNIVVRVATPPAFTPVAIPGSVLAQPVFQIVGIASKGTEPIVKDETENLVALARKGNLLKFHIKSYKTPSKKSVNVLNPSPPPPSPPPPPPPSPPVPPGPPTTTGANAAIPDVSEAGPFPEIDYLPTDLIGVGPPKNPAPLPPPASPPPPGSPPAPPTPRPDPWTPIESSYLQFFEDYPSAVYIPAIQSCISTPYFAPESKRHLNGVINDARNPSPGVTTYLWEINERSKNREFPNLTPHSDGSIILSSQPKDSENPYADIFLQPYKFEDMFGLKNGKLLNAFSLILGIQHGGREHQPQTAIWTVEITFGDMTLKLFEGSAEIEVSIAAGKDSTVPEKITIQPSTAAYVTDNFGERPYLLTFIPVWNGILMSHGVPASSDWGSTITFFPKDRALNSQTQLSLILNEQQTKEQKEAGFNPYPPKITVTRDGKKYKAPGVFLKGSKIAQIGKKGQKNYQAQSIANSDFKMGDKLTLRFHRCGGKFKFVPIWFTPYQKYHYLFSGPADPGDIPKEAPARRPPDKPKVRPKRRGPSGVVSGGPRPVPPGLVGPPKPPKNPPPKGKDPTTIPSEPDVFDVKSKATDLVLPVLNFSSDPIDFRTHITTIVKSASNPFSCVSMEFRSVNLDIRRPIQVWGFVLAKNVDLIRRETLFPPASDEGFLTIDDLPELRIRRFSISRGLDGCNGEITWDRNDPINGLLPRPPQRIGALRVALTGGANTIPGIVFTGIAMGNAQEDSPDENHVRIPLRGREAKLDSDGGIAVWNCPVFDGWDHRDAMAFLANYGGVPIDSTLAQPFKLISSLNIENPILFFLGGTGVNQAMDTVTKESMSLFYFDRFGTLIHCDAEVSTGVNWIYPDVKLETFSDEPDFQWMRNELVVLAQVGTPGSQIQANSPNTPTGKATLQVPSEVVQVRVPITTIPNFPWARQAVYQIPQILPSRSEVIRLALRYAEARARPRATARCQIPPNANIELLDTLNDNWIITSISHEADTQSKRWTMSLGVELFVGAEALVGPPITTIFPELG